MAATGLRVSRPCLQSHFSLVRTGTLVLYGVLPLRKLSPCEITEEECVHSPTYLCLCLLAVSQSFPTTHPPISIISRESWPFSLARAGMIQASCSHPWPRVALLPRGAKKRLTRDVF